MEKIKNFIGGKFLTPISKKYLENYDPAKGEIYSLVPDSDSRDIKTAVDMSNSVFPFWSNLPLKDRANYLMKIAHEIEKNLEMLAMAESKDNGKPLWLCKSVDIPRAASNFKFFASCITQFSSKFCCEKSFMLVVVSKVNLVLKKNFDPKKKQTFRS